MSDGMKIATVCTAALLLLCLGIGSCATGCVPNYSNGFRCGIITKLSRKGVVWKSLEGEMLTGGMEQATGKGQGGTLVPQVFDFSVTDPAIADQIEKAALEGARVELKYRQWLVGPISQDTGYDIIACKRQADLEKPK